MRQQGTNGRHRDRRMTASTSNGTRRSRGGMVLIIVSIVMALVSLAAFGFLVSMKTENRSAHLQADQLQVQQIAASGAQFLETLARMPRKERLAWGPLHDNPELLRDIRVDRDLLGQRHGRFCILAPRYDEESSVPEFVFGVQYASSKLSLSSLLQWDQLERGRGRTALMNLPGMNESLADAILDWIDQDDEPREFGAEAEFYLGLDPPRQPPNRIPPRIDDLLAVRGMDTWQLLGKQEGMFRIATRDAADIAPDSRNASVTADETLGQTDLRPAPPWNYFLTVVSAERNENYAGQPRIDLNQANLTKLQAALSAVLDQDIARFVIAYRQFGPATSDIQSALTEPIPAVQAGQPARFQLSTPLDLVDAVVEIPDTSGDSEDATKAYASPFNQQRPTLMNKLVEFCDLTTVDTAPVIEGRVNIQQAPRPVLLAIPGLLPDQVDQILSARRGAGDAMQAREHAAWLLTENLVTLDIMKQIWPYITVNGDVLSAQIVAFYDAQSPWYRQEIVIDGTSKVTPRLYYRDLRRLGIGFHLRQLVSPVAAERGSATDSPFTPPTRTDQPTPAARALP